MRPNARSLLRPVRLLSLAVASLGLAACARDSMPTSAPVQFVNRTAAATGISSFSSSSPGITAWDPIFPAAADPTWPTTSCVATPAVGLNANWVNPHTAFSGFWHPWMDAMGFTASWINAWDNITSQGPDGQSYTRYSMQVSGTGQYVINLLADNCSWVYLDNNLVGIQGANWGPGISGIYPVNMNGPAQLTFIIFDGGGAAGGKFLLETRDAFIARGGDPSLLPPPIDDSDHTPPVITFTGNQGTYTVDQTVAITCSATDAGTGIATSNCPGASGPAYLFGVGTTTLNASATDKAGNSASASTQFTVQVTSGSLCSLVQRWVNQAGVANSMCQQLTNGAYGAFRNHVTAQSGKFVTAANAAILISLSKSL